MQISIITRLLDGLINGPKEIRIDKYTSIRALYLPKSFLNESSKYLKNIDGKACLYFLINNQSDSFDIYIGESDSIINRINDHKVKKDWWEDSIVIFYDESNLLSKSDTRYIEEVLLKKFNPASYYKLQNQNGRNSIIQIHDTFPRLKEFENQVVLIIESLGINIFKDFNHSNLMKNIESSLIYPNKYIEVFCKNAKGKYFIDDNSVVVLEGSLAKLNDSQHFSQLKYSNLKMNLIEQQVLVKLDQENFKFITDVEFDSPSAAATIILGRSANGLTEWRDSFGNTLKELSKN